MSKFTTIHEFDLGKGIDQRSSENQIPAGYSEEAINADFIDTRVGKRKGYQQYGGYLPLRAQKIIVEDSGGFERICVNFDGAIDISRQIPGPVYLRGTTDISWDGVAEDTYGQRWYDSYSISLRQLGDQTILPEVHGFTTTPYLAGATRSLSQTNLSNSVFIPDDLISNKVATTNELVSTFFGVTSPDQWIPYFLDASGGAPNFETFEVASGSWVSEGGNLYSTTLSTTGLRNFNFIVQLYQMNSTTFDASTALELVQPEDITIDSSGDIQIFIEEATPSDYFIIVHTPLSNQVIGGTASAITSPSLGVTTETISSDSAFIFTGIYTFNTVTEKREIVIPDLIEYDDITREYTITFTNTSTEAVNYEIYYSFGSLLVNQICLETDTAYTSDKTTFQLELDVYGIDPEEIYPTADRGSWLTHVDSYKTRGLSELVTGVGGVFYHPRDLDFADLRPRTKVTATETRVLGPAFQETASTITRTRGAARFDGGTSNFAEVDSVEFVSVGVSKYTLLVPNLDLDGDLITDIITIGKDKLTVGQMGYPLHEGTFPITSLTVVADTLEVEVTNSAVTDNTFDEVDAGGQAGVFTDILDLPGTSDLIELFPGDFLEGGGLPSNTLQVESVSNTTPEIILSGVTSLISISDGVTVFGRRTSDLVPTVGGLEDTFVPGDMLTYSGAKRLTKIKHIRPEATEVITISGNTITLSSTLTLGVGQKLAILTDGEDSGTYTINNIANATTLTLTKSLTSTTGRVLGQVIEIDEELRFRGTLDGSIFFGSTHFWESLEHPTYLDTSTRLDGTYFPTYYDVNPYENQPYIRSASVSDNLYFTNGDDEVYRYDGSVVTQAGLYRWEGLIFNSVTTSGGIPFTSVSSTVSGSANGKKLNFGAIGDVTKFSAGDRVEYRGQNYIVEEVIANSTDSVFRLILDRHIEDQTTSGATVATIGVYRYYFRLNLIDRNQNIIGSAAAGSAGDFVVFLTESSDVHFRIALPPILGNLDYDSLQLEIYRTAVGGEIYSRITSIPVDYSKSFITYTDSAADSSLIDADEIGNLFSSTVANAIEEPLRARYITSANNRLILGNLSDYKSVDLQLYSLQETLLPTSFTGMEVDISDGTDTQTYIFSTTTGTTITEVKSTNTFELSAPLAVSVGDIVYVYQDDLTQVEAQYLGWFKVTGVAGSDITVESDLDNITFGSTVRMLGVSGKIPIRVGTDRNYTPFLQDAGGTIQFSTRLARAINSVQALEANPLVVASGDSDFGEGQIILRRPVADTKTITVTVKEGTSTIFTKASLFLDQIKAVPVSGEVVTTLQEIIYPSRLLVSFPNFAEIFDRPRARLASDSASVIDVNSSDGQEITGIIPFFGDSTSQDSRKQDIVICFKENSIYAVNITTKQITKIDSRGIGCTAPYSIANVPNGVMFANESGVYRLNRSFDVIWVGQRIDRKWKEEIERDRLDLMQGHIYPQEQQYKLSYPVDGDKANTEVFVYDYGDEGPGQTGAWSQYNNHPTTGWANLLAEAYFGSTKGRVYSIRNLEEDSDFRDDDQPIAMRFTYRPLHFGDPGSRKILRRIISNFRILKTSSNTTLSVATDLSSDFEQTSVFTVAVETAQDNLSDEIGKKILVLRHSIPVQRGVYFQLKYENAAKDETLELSGISFAVSGLTDAGIIEAADTGDS